MQPGPVADCLDSVQSHSYLGVTCKSSTYAERVHYTNITQKANRTLGIGRRSLKPSDSTVPGGTTI